MNWICDFLMHRHQRVKMENDIYSEWKDVVAGVPQGTKLGPWLFLVMINDLEISSADGNVIFVDDITSFEIVEKDKSSLMRSIADEASLWSNDNTFQIQPKKCKELRISFKKIPGIYGVGQIPLLTRIFFHIEHHIESYFSTLTSSSKVYDRFLRNDEFEKSYLVCAPD